MILSRLGQLYLTKGDARQAIAYYEPAVQLDPMDVGTIDGLGSAYSANGQLAEATMEFQRALAIEPYIPAYNGLGLVAVKQHDFITARQNFERAIQIDPGCRVAIEPGCAVHADRRCPVWTDSLPCISGECSRRCNIAT